MKTWFLVIFLILAFLFAGTLSSNKSKEYKERERIECLSKPGNSWNYRSGCTYRS